MKKLDARLIRMISHSKGQFISVTVIIAAALCIFMLFSMTTVNINDAVDSYYKQSRANDVQIQLVRMPESVLRDLQRMEGIDGVQGRVKFDVSLHVEESDDKVTLRLISVPPDGEQVNRLYWIDGIPALPGFNDVVMLQQFADARSIKLGDSVMPVIDGTVRDLKVIGIASNIEFLYLMENEQALLPTPEKFGVGFVNEEFAQKAYGFEGNYNELLITIKPGSDLDGIIDELENKLDQYGVKRVIKLEDQLSHNVLKQKMEGIEKMQVIMPVMFLLVAAIVIVIMLSRTVSNDRIAIGVMKGMGYSNNQILMHYSKYSLAMGLVGSVVGIAGGVALSAPLSQVFVYYFNIPMVKMNIYPAYILNALVLTSIFCVGSGLIGARAVLIYTPADSMRPEAPRSGKRVLLERIPLIWNRLSSGWKMVIRNVMRSKRRFSFLVLGLALSFAINTVPIYESNALTSMFKLQYGVYQKMDYTIELIKPQNRMAINELKDLLEVDAIEPKLEYPYELSNGWLKKSTMIIGVPGNTVFYEFRDPDDRQTSLIRNTIFLTETLARILQVKKGDILTVRNFLPGREDLSIPVGGIVRQYLGSNAFMDLNSMQELLVGKDIINGMNLTSPDDVKEKLRDVNGISSTRSIHDMENSFLEFMDTMILATRMYMLFGGILSFALIYNATLIGIMERSQEFSAMRVMGYGTKEIFGIISRESMLMTAMAILVGIPMGIGMMNGIVVAFSSEIVTFPRLFPSWIFVQSSLAMMLFVSIAQLSTYMKIRDLKFVDVLKSWIS